MRSINDHTKAPRADEPSMDISKSLRKLRLGPVHNSKLEVSSTGTNMTAQHDQKGPTSSPPQPSWARKHSAQDHRRESNSRPSGVDEEEKRRVIIPSADRNPYQSVLRPGRHSSRDLLENIFRYSHEQRVQYQLHHQNYGGARSFRVDHHSALRSKEYVACCNEYPIPPLPQLNPPSYATTTLKSSYDIDMASRHTRIGDLPIVDRQKQEVWAKSQMKLVGTCPENFPWDRMAGGFKCQAGSHFITDQLLAEGKGGILIGPWYPGERTPFGPYYLDPKDGGYHYAGTNPREAPDVFYPWTSPRNPFNMRYGMALPGGSSNARPELSGPQMVGIGGHIRHNMQVGRYAGPGGPTQDNARAPYISLVRHPNKRRTEDSGGHGKR